MSVESPSQSPSPSSSNPPYFRNPDLIAELRMSRCQGRAVTSVLNSYFDNNNVFISDELKRHSLVEVLEAIFTNINESSVVSDLNAMKDNQDSLATFLNQLSEFVTFHSNFAPSSEVMVQFQPSDVLKHINNSALTGAVTGLTFGGLLALKNAKFRAIATGAGIIGGAAYLAVDSVLEDSEQNAVFLKYSDAIIRNFDLDRQIPAYILNSLFLPFITEPGVSSVTFAEINLFITSEGRTNYDKIVNKSLILKTLFETLNTNPQHKAMYFEALQKVFQKIFIKNDDVNDDVNDDDTFASHLILHLKDKVIHSLRPETVVAPLVAIPEPPVDTDLEEDDASSNLQASDYNDHMPSWFTGLESRAQIEALNSTIPVSLNSYFSFDKVQTYVSASGSPTPTDADILNLKAMQTDLMGNGYMLVNIGTTRSPEAVMNVKQYLINYFRDIDPSFNESRLETLGFVLNDGKYYVPVVITNLFTGDHVHTLHSSLSLSAFQNRSHLESLNEGTFEYFFHNPTERILLKLAGLEVRSVSDLSRYNGAPADRWPQSLGSIESISTGTCQALKARVMGLQENRNTLNSANLFNLLSQLLVTSINSVDTAKLQGLLRSLTGANSIAGMVAITMQFNIAVLNDEYKNTHNTSKGFYELYTELTNVGVDRHLAATMAHALQFTESRDELVPNLQNVTFDTLKAYALRVKSYNKSITSFNVFDDGLSLRDIIRLRNMLSRRHLTPKDPSSAADVAAGEFIITTADLSSTSGLRKIDEIPLTTQPDASTPATELFLYTNNTPRSIEHNISADDTFAIFTSSNT